MSKQIQAPLQSPITTVGGQLAPHWVPFIAGTEKAIQNLTRSGPSSARPQKDLYLGQVYFDTTMNRPVWLTSLAPIVWSDLLSNSDGGLQINDLQLLNAKPNSFMYSGLDGKVTTTITPPNGALLIGTGQAPQIGYITGKANQVIVDNEPGRIKLSLPQDLGPSSSVTFEHVTVRGQLIVQPGSIQGLTPLRTKGDLFTRTNQGDARLPVGTQGQVLAVDANSTTGLVWQNKGELHIPFSYGDASPKKLFTIPAGKRIVKVELVIDMVFDTPATLSIGSVPNELMATEDNATQMQAVFETNPSVKYQSATDVNLYINPNMASQGSGVVIINYQS